MNLVKLFFSISSITLLICNVCLAQTDPYDPNSPNYVGNKVKVKIPKWNGSLSTTFFRGFDELAEAGLYYDLVAGYQINSKWRADGTVAYSHPVDMDAANPRRWEFEDVRLRLLRPSIWRKGTTNLTLIGSFSLPTSKTSQDASLYFSSSFTGNLTKRFNKLTFSLTPRVVGAWHQFESRDQSGFVPNSPLGLSLGASARLSVTRRLGLVAGGSLYTAFDYEFRVRTIQTLFSSLQFTLSKKSFLSLSARWRDRRLTNNSVFDDDASAYTVSFGYIL